jgi:AcrR family transcriptional regulator
MTRRRTSIAAMPERAAKRAGRRPGESGTRDLILATARTQFADHGYDAASVRGIARAADVDPALVLHYFGSKAELFAAALELPFEADAVVQRVIDGPRAQLGRRLALFFLSIWGDPARREPMMAMLRAATTSRAAAALLRERLAEGVLRPIGERLGQPDADLRMSLCASHLVGLGITRYIVFIEPLASLEPERVADLVAPALQRYMTGKL